MRDNPLDTKRSANRLLLLVCIVFLLCNMLLPSLLPQDNPMLFTLLATLLGEGALLLPALLFIRAKGGGAAFGLCMPRGKGQILWGLGLGFAGFLLATGINSFMQALWLWLGVTTLDTSAAAFTGGGWNILTAFFCIVAIPVIAEETLFRGALLHAWLPQNRTIAVWRSALFFALLHLNPMALPAYLVLGLLMASVTVLSGSILPAMLVHGVNNLLVLLISYASTPEFVAEAELMMQPGEYLFSAAVYLLLGAVIGRACHRRFRVAVARREATRRLFRLPNSFADENSIFLPPEPPEGGATDAEEGEEEAATADAPLQVPEVSPAAPQPDTAASEEAARPRRLRLQGTGRGSLLAAYLLLALVNLLVFLVAIGAWGVFA